jgi:hypothetical protein
MVKHNLKSQRQNNLKWREYTFSASMLYSIMNVASSVVLYAMLKVMNAYEKLTASL